MARRGTGEVAEKLLIALSDQSEMKGGLSIQDIATKSSVNWETTKRYLEMFTKLNVVIELKQDDKVLYQKVGREEPDTLFGIPLSQNNRATIQTIYSTIHLLWKEKYGNAPLYKTFIQKVAVDVVETRFPQVPRGWYLYGELLPLAPVSDESTPFEAGTEEFEAVKKAFEDYSSCKTTREIRLRQYQRRGKRLYLVKEQLSVLISSSLNRDLELFRKINEFAIDVEETENNEKTKAIVEAFATSLLSICRNSEEKNILLAKPAVIEVFNRIWELIAACEYYESMKQFYDVGLLNYYMSNYILDKEELSMEALEALEQFEPKLQTPDSQQIRALKSLRGAGKDISPEERTKREKKLEEMSSSELLGAYGLN